ncbi:MAG: DUF4142 domain-containing protein [Ferruginibacter sp.]
MKKILFSLLVISGVLVVSCNSNSSTTPDSPKAADQQNDKKFDTTNMQNDADFAVFAADGGMAEVALGKLAQANGSGKEVKDLAAMLVMDHENANGELKAIAASNNITLPAGVSDKHKQKYDELAAKKGADFDKAYLDAMEDGHKATIEQFQKEADKGNNATLKQWAIEKLPTLQHHLETIQKAKMK